MTHRREKTIDAQGRKRPIPCRGPVAAAVVLLGLLGILAPAGALDFTGRIDTRYLFQTGDNAFDNDIYNYHSLELTFFKNFTFSWYGGVIASLSPRVNTISADGTETTDNALRTLQDAGNPGQYINYTIYSAYLKYDAGAFGAILGRSTPADYDLTQFDGIIVWAAPFQWLRLEALGGLPWHYAYVANPGIVSQYWTAGEMAAGGGADLRFFDESLKFSLKYLFLREVANSSGLINTPSTYLSADSLTKGSVSFAGWPWLNAGAAASVLDASPLSARAWVSGNVELINLSYSADCEMQFLGVSSISDRLTEFAAILTASDPYVDVSMDLTENFAGFGFFPREGFLSDVELELTYEHRQPLSPADQSMFNPQYDQFRVATLLGAKGGWTLQAFYSFLLTSGIQNTLHVVGGEIGKKWSFLDVRLGSSFNASFYQTDYTQTVLEDSFYAQEYYLKVKWQVSRPFDVSLKAAYENVLLTSITSAAPLNPDVDYAYLAGLNDYGRNYFRFEVRAGFRY
jgi:hypothetical protein